MGRSAREDQGDAVGADDGGLDSRLRGNDGAEAGMAREGRREGWEAGVMGEGRE